MKKILLFCCAMACCIGLKANESSFPEKVYDDLFVFEVMDGETDLTPLYAFIDKYADVIKDGKAPIYVSSYSNSMPISKINSVNASEHAQKIKSDIKAKGISDSHFVLESISGRYDQYYPIVIVQIGIPEGYGKEGASKYTPTTTVAAAGELTVTADKIVLPEESESDTEAPKEAKAPKEPRKFIDLSQSSINVRTNLLLWAALTGNIGVEWRVGPNVGVLAHGAGSYISWDDAYKTYRVWYASPEVRWYLGARKRGYVGAAGHIGELNFKLHRTGYRGQFIGGGLTGGYQTPITKRLSVDFSIGAGYTRFEHDRYVMETRPGIGDVSVVQKKDDVFEWWGPNQVGVSLVWHFIR